MVGDLNEKYSEIFTARLHTYQRKGMDNNKKSKNHYESQKALKNIEKKIYNECLKEQIAEQ